ncbi:MFS transporter [Bradyrhizobium sp. 14AA]
MIDAELSSYSSQERFLVATSAVFGFGLDFYNLIIMAFLLGQIQSSLSISLPQAGIIVSATLASSVIGGILIGYVGDKFGRKAALMASLLLLAIGAILSAIAWSFASLLIFRIIAGIGVGGEWGAGMVLFNEVWDSRKRGFGSAIVQASAAGGTALASIVAAWTLTHLDADMAWRVAVAIGGLPLVLMLFVRRSMPESRLWSAFEQMREMGELPPAKANERNSVLEIMLGASLRYFVLGGLMAGGYVFSYQSGTVFMPLLMGRDLHASPTVIRDVVLLWSIPLAVGMLTTGYVSDKYGRRLSVIVANVLVIVGFIGIYASGSTQYPGNLLVWPLFWFYVLWGFAQGAGGQFGPWYAELYPVELRATATSTIFTAGRLIGSTAPYLIPILAASFGNLRQAITFGMLGVLVSIIAALLLPETVGRQFAVIESKSRAKEGEGETRTGKLLEVRRS